MLLPPEPLTEVLAREAVAYAIGLAYVLVLWSMVRVITAAVWRRQ